MIIIYLCFIKLLTSTVIYVLSLNNGLCTLYLNARRLNTVIIFKWTQES